MYKLSKPNKTTIRQNKCVEGESIETKVRRIKANKEPIKDGAQPLYTERKDGVLPETDIRTDRMERALENMDKFNRGHQERRGKSTVGSEAKEGMMKEAPGTPPIEPSQQS